MNNATFFAQLSKAQNSKTNKDDDDEDNENSGMTPMFQQSNCTSYVEPKKAAFMISYRMLNLGYNTTTVYNIKMK